MTSWPVSYDVDPIRGRPRSHSTVAFAPAGLLSSFPLLYTETGLNDRRAEPTPRQAHRCTTWGAAMHDLSQAVESIGKLDAIDVPVR